MTTQESIPSHWSWCRVGEAFHFTGKQRGLDITQHEYVPFVPMDLIPIHRMRSSDHIMKPSSDLRSGTYIENGDLLVSKITPCFENGKQTIIDGLPLPFGYATTEVIPLKGIDGVSDVRYLYFYLTVPQVRNEIAARMEGATGRQRLSKSVLESWEMALPPLPEQQAIADACALVLSTIEIHQGIIDRNRELLFGVLPNLMSGTLRTTNLQAT